LGYDKRSLTMASWCVFWTSIHTNHTNKKNTTIIK